MKLTETTSTTIIAEQYGTRKSTISDTIKNREKMLQFQQEMTDMGMKEEKVMKSFFNQFFFFGELAVPIPLRGLEKRISNKLRLSKCQFVQAEVNYLGHVVSAQGVKTDPRKTKTIREYPAPTDVKQLWKFLGLTNN